ncbi:hypothetical protein [Profundibacter sp.]
MEADFCAEVLKDAIAKYGKPENLGSPSRAFLRNTLPAMDQGCQFTGFEWTQALKDADVKIPMDGKVRNAFKVVGHFFVAR